MCIPIALFVHSRLDHTQQTVAALQHNTLAEKTPLYIFSDAASEHKAGESAAVKAVRDYLSIITGFLSVNVVERPENWGLKRNIIDGLNCVTAQYDAVIVVEDDCVTSPDFLHYMNQQLKAFKHDEAIWHIAAWNPGVDFNCETYPSYFMSCWGWATWKDRWQRLQLDPIPLMANMSIRDRYRFNLKGRYPFYSHLVGNFIGVNNTWAVFWYATIFTSGGYCINPNASLIKNLGMDGSGSHQAIHFDQAAPSVDLKHCGELVTLNATLDALANVYGLKQSRFQYLVALLKMLAPLSLYKLVKAMKG